jgi:hypothetical protein
MKGEEKGEDMAITSLQENPIIGLFFAEDPAEKERFLQMQALTTSAMELIATNRQNIQENLENCRKKTQETLSKCQNYVLELSMKVLSEEVSDSDFDKGNFLIAISQQVNKRFFESAIQLRHITQICEENTLSQNKAFMEMVFLDRMKAIELCNASIDLMTKQQNHQLEIEAIAHQQKLKEHSQQFDQLLQKLKFKDQQRQQECSRELRERQQQRLEDATYQDLASRRARIQQQHQAEVCRLAQEKAKALGQLR